MRLVGVNSLFMVCAALLGGCSDQPQYRYKLTIEMEVDGQILRGFNVVKVLFGKHWYEGTLGTAVTGEALVLDLGNGRQLVALLTNKSCRKG